MRRLPEPPLYDSRYEHDACGIGFVADAGDRSRDRVLPLALAGLGALAHRGAFAADGESSDGAGVALPLSRSVVATLAPGFEALRPGIVQLFLPRGRRRLARARVLIAEALAAEGLAVERWRRVPHDPAALGAEAAAAMPSFRQAVVLRPERLSAAAFERRLILARRRIEAAAQVAGLDELAVPSASSQTIVYKGLVAGGRLAELFPDLAAGWVVPYALFHQRYATNTHPVWRLAQPFRAIAHNGEINTVRGNREQVRGRHADPGAGVAGRALLAAGPLITADGSDSLSLDEGLELLTMTGWDLPMALLATIPEALPVRLAPHPQVASLQRRTRGYLAPWDGPAAIVFADGRRVGALLDRNGLRPVAFAVTRDRLVAVASEAGAVPLTAAETVRRGRLGPGQMLLVDPAARRILEDTEAKAVVLETLPIHDEPHPAQEDRPVASHGDPTPHAFRYLAGLDAERARLDIRTMALEAHEPLWSMGDDTPTPGRGRLHRRAADHLRQAFAQVTNPPIDPERERVVMDLRVELGRRPPLLGGLPRGPRTIRLERPVVADPGPLLDAFPGAVTRLDATWDPTAGPAGLEDALRRLGPEAVRAASGRSELLVVSDRAFDLERLPIPSVLAIGAVHTALTGAGLRGRADILAEAADILDAHSLAMALACGATAVNPWLAVEAAAELAGTRGAEELDAEAVVRSLVGAFDAGLRKTLARMGISAVASYIGGGLFDTIELDPSVVARCFPAAAAWPGRVTFGDLARRQLARLDAAARPPRSATRPRSATARPGLRPLPSRWRGPPLRAEDRGRRPGPGQRRRIDGRCGAGGVSRLAAARRRRRPRRPPGPARDPDPVERGGIRPLDRAAVRGLGDERGCPVAGGPPGADDRDPAGRRRGEHRRGRRGPRLVRPRPERRAARCADQAGRLGAVRRLSPVPRPRRPAGDQDRPGLEARRGRPAARPEGDRVHRRAPSRPAWAVADQPAAPPRHLLDRGPGPADRGPAGHQPGREGRRQARRLARRRDDRGGRRQGRGRLRPPVGAFGRHRRLAAVVDQACRRAVGAGPRGGPPGPAPEQSPRPDGASNRRRAPDGARPAHCRAPGGGGVRLRDRDARRDRLRHGPPVPPRYVPDRHRHAARGPPGQVHRHAGAGRAVRAGPCRGPAAGAGGHRRPKRRRGGRRGRRPGSRRRPGDRPTTCGP